MDLIGAPASSSADERTFSNAGQVLEEGGYNTLADLAEANQCLKSWCYEGLIWRHQITCLEIVLFDDMPVPGSPALNRNPIRSFSTIPQLV
jgi:hypothetical protein